MNSRSTRLPWIIHPIHPDRLPLSCVVSIFSSLRALTSIFRSEVSAFLATFSSCFKSIPSLRYFALIGELQIYRLQTIF